MSEFSLHFKTFSPQGGTLPNRKNKDRSRRPKDSGSSGNDRDRSSGSRKSDGRKSDRIVRKPSKELLKIQNFTDSSEDEIRLSSNRDPLLKRNGSNKVSDSRSYHEQLSYMDRKDDLVTGEGGSSRTDVGSSLSPTGSRKSPNISRQSQSPKKTSAKARQSPENQRKGGASLQQQSKSLNSQIKDFMKSPPKNRKASETSNKFDAFNHTSSHKLTHPHAKEADKPPPTMASLSTYPVQFNESSFDEYEFNYHPRRSSKEVLDFTSSRKAMKDKSSKSEDKETLDQNKSFKEDKGHKSDGSEGHNRRKDPDFLHCQCLSPKKESETLCEDASPSRGRNRKEVFDFTSKKVGQPPVNNLKTRKQGSREHKEDNTRKEVDVSSSAGSSQKSPRRKEERNVFDFGIRNESGIENEYATLRKKRSEHRVEGEYATLRRKGNGSSGKGNGSSGTEGEYATLKRKKSSRREVLDFTSGSSREVLDFTSSADHREVLDFTSNSRLGNGSANTSQEILNLKSSSEFLGSKCNSREMLNKEKVEMSQTLSEVNNLIEPWQEVCLGGGQPASHAETSCREGFESSRGGGDGLSSGNSKEDLYDDKNRDAFSPQPQRETIDPPDLFNTNKIFPAHTTKEEKILDVHFAPDLVTTEEKLGKDPYKSVPSTRRSATVEESTLTSAQRRRNYKTQTERSKRIRNRSLEMVLDETNVGSEQKPR